MPRLPEKHDRIEEIMALEWERVIERLLGTYKRFPAYSFLAWIVF